MEFDVLDSIFSEEISEISKKEVQIDDAPEDINRWHKRVCKEYDYLYTIGMDFDVSVRNDFQMCRRIKEKYKYGIFELINYMRMLEYLGDTSEIKVSMNMNCQPRNRGGSLEIDFWSPRMLGDVNNMMYLNVAFSPKVSSAAWLSFIVYITDLAKRRKNGVIADLFGKDIDGLSREEKYNIIKEIRMSDMNWNTIIRFNSDNIYSAEKAINAMNLLLTDKLKFDEKTSYDIASKLVMKISKGHLSMLNFLSKHV